MQPNQDQNPVHDALAKPVDGPALVRPKEPLVFLVEKITGKDEYNLFDAAGTLLPPGHTQPYGSGTLSVEEGQRVKIMFGNSPTATIQTEAGPITIGDDPENPEKEPRKAVDRLIYRDSRGEIVWNEPICRPGYLLLDENGDTYDNRALFAAGRETDVTQAALIALGLSADKITSQPAGHETVIVERTGDPKFCMFGERLTHAISDGEVKRSDSEQEGHSSVATNVAKASQGRYVAAISDTVFRQMVHITETPLGPMRSAPGSFEEDDWPNTARSVEKLVLLGDERLENVIPRLFTEVYGFGASPELPVAFRSLADAQEYLSRTFDIQSHPSRGDLLHIAFKDKVPLAERFELASINETSFAMRQIFMMFGGEKEGPKREGKGDIVHTDDGKIVFSILPVAGRSVQRPEAIARLLQVYGHQLFEPYFGDTGRQFLAACKDPAVADAYIGERAEFRCFKEGDKVELRWRLKGADRQFMRFDEQKHQKGDLYSPGSDLDHLVHHLTDAGRFDELRSLAQKRSDKTVVLEPDYPSIHGMEKKEDGWYSKKSLIEDELVRVCGLEGNMEFSLTDPAFRAALTRLDGESEPGGLRWKPESERRLRKALSPGKSVMSWAHPMLQERRSSYHFGAVLTRGAPVYIDLDKALIQIAPGETKEVFFVLAKRHFGKADFRENVVAGVAISCDAEGKLSFSPPVGKKVFRCGAEGSDSREAVCVQE